MIDCNGTRSDVPCCSIGDNNDGNNFLLLTFIIISDCDRVMTGFFWFVNLPVTSTECVNIYKNIFIYMCVCVEYI